MRAFFYLQYSQQSNRNFLRLSMSNVLIGFMAALYRNSTQHEDITHFSVSKWNTIIQTLKYPPENLASHFWMLITTTNNIPNPSKHVHSTYLSLLQIATPTRDSSANNYTLTKLVPRLNTP